MQKDFFKETLSNGVTILFEKRNTPVVSVASFVKEGSAYESENQKGISHFIEHLLFKGTNNRSYLEIAKEIEKKGGVLNGYTEEEATAFWCKLPKKHFFSGVDIVSDLISNPKFDSVEFEKEKKVILEEIKMYRDNPQIHSLMKIKEMLFEKPFGMEGIGTEENINSISRENAVNFYKKNYCANKMAFCVVGNADFEELKEYAQKIKKTSGIVTKISPVKINNKLICQREGIDQANLVLGFHTQSNMRYAYKVFNSILTNGMSSKLFEEIREKRGLAYSVRGGIEEGKDFSYHFISVGTVKDKIKECEKLVLEEMKKVKSLKQKELEEAKEQLIGLNEVENEESVNTMNSLIHEETLGEAYEHYNYEKNILKVSLKELAKISKINDYGCFALVPK